MRYKLATIALAAIPLHAQSHKWQISVAFFTGSQAADVMSSQGGIEANPLLGANRPFGIRQGGIKLGLSGGIILGEWLILRHHPKAERSLTWLNYVAGGVTSEVAVRNWTK